jgi:hypothetical protein
MNTISKIIIEVKSCNPILMNSEIDFHNKRYSYS